MDNFHCKGKKIHHTKGQPRQPFYIFRGLSKNHTEPTKTRPTTHLMQTLPFEEELVSTLSPGKNVHPRSQNEAGVVKGQQLCLGTIYRDSRF